MSFMLHVFDQSWNNLKIIKKIEKEQDILIYCVVSEFFFFFNFFPSFYIFGGRDLPYSQPGWPQTPNHHAWASPSQYDRHISPHPAPHPHTSPHPVWRLYLRKKICYLIWCLWHLSPRPHRGEITGPHANYSSQAPMQLPSFPCAWSPFPPNGLAMAEQPGQDKWLNFSWVSKARLWQRLLAITQDGCGNSLSAGTIITGT